MCWGTFADYMDKLLTPQNLAQLTGLSLQTIYNRRNTGGSLPACIRICRLLRFHLGDVKTWLATQYESPLLSSVDNTSPRKRGRPTKEEQLRKRNMQNKLSGILLSDRHQ